MALVLRGSRTNRLAEAKLYVCVDSRGGADGLAAFAQAAYSGGVDILQLRDKPAPGDAREPLEAAAELELLARLGETARQHGALFAVNDRADLAFAAGADVLHLGQGDLPVDPARQIIGQRRIVGRSTHSLDQARAAIDDPDVDYFCVGPCWTTPTKPGRPAVGLDLVAQVAGLEPDKPWFAIGGIDLERLPQVRAAGATRVVVVRAVTDVADPKAAAEALRAGLG